MEEEGTKVMSTKQSNEEVEQVPKSQREAGGAEVRACQNRENQRIVVERSKQLSKEEVQV